MLQMAEASRVIVTHQNLKDIEKMLSETFERVIQGSRYSHLSATRKKVVSTFVTQKKQVSSSNN